MGAQLSLLCVLCVLCLIHDQGIEHSNTWLVGADAALKPAMHAVRAMF